MPDSPKAAPLARILDQSEQVRDKIEKAATDLIDIVGERRHHAGHAHAAPYEAKRPRAESIPPRPPSRGRR